MLVHPYLQNGRFLGFFLIRKRCDGLQIGATAMNGDDLAK